MNISKVVENHDLAGNQKQVKCVVAAAFNLGTNSLICYSPTCCLLNQKNFVTFKEISKFDLHLIFSWDTWEWWGLWQIKQGLSYITSALVNHLEFQGPIFLVLSFFKSSGKSIRILFIFKCPFIQHSENMFQEPHQECININEHKNNSALQEPIF